MRETPAPYAHFRCAESAEPHGDDAGAVDQMENALWLPMAIAGALMPDAHTGYGLPIGGVLAVDNAVIPYAVGMDIACRMRLSVLDFPLARMREKRESLLAALETQTRFGVGGSFRPPLEHPVLAEDWGFCRLLKEQRHKAAEQLGTSGSGNHFVEFGELHVLDTWGDLPAGRYSALLSHSGSRGVGGAVAQHYSRLARTLLPGLPNRLRHLAWFELGSAEGREYWAAMELMGRYSEANHQLIHRRIVGALGLEVLATVENHHNFAWVETVAGRPAVVHRKGATPAHLGRLGVIPGSMTAPGFVVRGKGNPASLCSAAHGAGRRMSRTEARKRANWHQMTRELEAHGVTLMGGGLDEAPCAYKDIHAVMAAQAELVDVVGRFSPMLVKMDTF
ncbi:putative cytoplasmic protein RtcB [Megalodesulfovibrio gigas DSM 1382 = ATCC 19364]|uniref:3'-phosphate/5'-hydroxy nucleic acid ligase n=1 Tax=Megalodesulfovibrio gigas (strain ATCC 19364 / DSM 1382 / NCIMB 9332 / VKM B-1759) TaxID=1121448 RepID=T2G8E5_MEGG1|nr:putative cytoplasmic protein RtcB [Megalodesulfovibrio gigas DSM 1382 = ATCC 19364]